MFRTQLRMFILWKNDFPKIMAIERKQKYLQRCFFIKKHLNFWRRQLEEKRIEQKNIIKSEIIYKIILTKRYFQKLNQFKEYNQRIRLFYKAISQKNKENLVKNSLRNWILSFKINRNSKLIENEKNFCVIRDIFVALKKNYIAKKTKKLHILALDRFLVQKAKTKIQSCIQRWNIFTKRKHRKQNVIF